MRWKTITNFENYEVSDTGLVRNKKTQRILKGNKKTKGSRYGYFLIHLYGKNSKRRITTIHRLVAEAFIPNPFNLPQINHKDENSLNNCVDNLEWCTPKYNSNYGTIKARQRERMLAHNPFKNKKHSSEAIEKMRNAKLGKPSKRKRKVIINGIEYESITKAMEQLNLCTRAIYKKIKEEQLCSKR